MKEKTATFIGHRQCTGLDTENLRNEIEGLVQKGVCIFLNGGMGSFDWTCGAILLCIVLCYPQLGRHGKNLSACCKKRIDHPEPWQKCVVEDRANLSILCTLVLFQWVIPLLVPS